MDEINVATIPQDATPAAPSADTQAAINTDGAAPTAEQSAAPTVDKTISYKWMHAEEVLDLSKDEDKRKASEWLREGRYAVEKGKEYQRQIESELESLKKPLEPLTQKLGKKPNEVAEYFARQFQISEDAKLARAQGKSTEDVTAFREEREARQAAEAKANALETAEQTRQRHLQEASDFQTEFPNVDIQNLPEEVKENWLNSGKPLNEAYRIFSYAAKEAELTALQERIRTMESQQKAAEINAENAATAPGKLGEGATAEQPLTEKAISEMTPAELEKNHSKIWAYLTGAKK